RAGERTRANVLARLSGTPAAAVRMAALVFAASFRHGDREPSLRALFANPGAGTCLFRRCTRGGEGRPLGRDRFVVAGGILSGRLDVPRMGDADHPIVDRLFRDTTCGPQLAGKTVTAHGELARIRNRIGVAREIQLSAISWRVADCLFKFAGNP